MPSASETFNAKQTRAFAFEQIARKAHTAWEMAAGRNDPATLPAILLLKVPDKDTHLVGGEFLRLLIERCGYLQEQLSIHGLLSGFCDCKVENVMYESVAFWLKQSVRGKVFPSRCRPVLRRFGSYA